MNNKNAEKFYNKGLRAVKKGKLAHAKILFDQALEIQPNIIRILIGKGLVLTKAYRLREALNVFISVLEIDPTNKIALEKRIYIEKELQKRTLYQTPKKTEITNGFKSSKRYFRYIRDLNVKDAEKFKQLNPQLLSSKEQVQVIGDLPEYFEDIVEKVFENFKKKYPPIIPRSIFHEKQINQYLTLKLLNGRTYIYVNGKMFIKCIRLSLNIQKEYIPLYHDIESIDEAANIYKNTLLLNRIVQGPKATPVRDQNQEITPEQEFWGHCSNIQAWVENEYDTRILMSNISFPLLKKLSKAGDPLARKVYKEEIALRLESGYPSVVQYLLEQGFIGEFSLEEFETIVEYSDFIQKVSSDSRVLSLLLKKCNKKFPTLIEHIVLQILKLPEGYNALISAIQKDQHLPKFLQFLTKLSTLKFLLKLKNTLGKLLNQAGEKKSNQILSCIHAVNLQLSKHFIFKIKKYIFKCTTNQTQTLKISLKN